MPSGTKSSLLALRLGSIKQLRASLGLSVCPAWHRFGPSAKTLSNRAVIGFVAAPHKASCESAVKWDSAFLRFPPLSTTSIMHMGECLLMHVRVFADTNT